MSLPYPTTSSVIQPSEEESWDAPLIALTQKSKGDLRLLLHAFFSFLHRRTDLYVIHSDGDDGSTSMGFKEGDAEKIILASFRQFPLRRMKPRARQEEENPKEKDSTKAIETPKEVKESKQESSKEKSLKESIRYTKEGKQIPIGNGGKTSQYEWTQSLTETSIILPVPVNTSSKDLEITIQPSHLKIKHIKHIKHQDFTDLTNFTNFTLEGRLTNTIKVDESTWSLEGNALCITLEKVVKTWWKSVFEGEDEEIDTTLVDARCKISEYDAVTQGAIRKIMFDQRQERLGLPKSDEILHQGNYDNDRLRNVNIPGVEYIDQDKMKHIPK